MKFLTGSPFFARLSVEGVGVDPCLSRVLRKAAQDGRQYGNMMSLTYDEVYDRVHSLGELATLATSATSILSITQDPDGDAKDLAVLISKDPVLSAKVMRSVNSPFYGFRREVESIEDAIVLLGFREVERLSLAIAFISRFRAHGENARALNRLWMHSLVCGIAAEAMVEVYRLNNLPSGEVYLAALLHDIGKAIIKQVFPEVALDILHLMEAEGISEYEAEKRMLGGATHSLIGAWTSEHWSLPLAIVDSIQMHHTPDVVPAEDSLPKVIHFADAVCYRVKMGAAPGENVKPSVSAAAADRLFANAKFVETFTRTYEARRQRIEAIAKG